MWVTCPFSRRQCELVIFSSVNSTMVSVDVYVETFGKIEEVDMVCYFLNRTVCLLESHLKIKVYLLS